jgi:hypothetical protein
MLFGVSKVSEHPCATPHLVISVCCVEKRILWQSINRPAMNVRQTYQIEHQKNYEPVIPAKAGNQRFYL